MTECCDSHTKGAMSAIITKNGDLLEPTCEWLECNMDPSVMSIAAINGPNQIVISGHMDAIVSFEKILKSHPNVRTTKRMQQVSHAFHSPLMREASIAFYGKAASIFAQANLSPKYPIISNVTGRKVPISLFITILYCVIICLDATR